MKTFPKKVSLFLAGILFVSYASATLHTVSVQNFSFTPSSFSAAVGDTVEWVWAAGNHTTTSLSVPSGAATWDNPSNSTNTVFKYVITTPGTYNYWCSIHTTMMEASFTVTVTGVPAVLNASKNAVDIFPNPASNSVTIHLNTTPDNTKLVVLDVLGKEVLNENVTKIDNSIDVSTWKKGVYLYRLENKGKTIEGKFEVQ